MALSTAVPTVTSSLGGSGRYRVTGTLAIGASPLTYATGGIVLNFLQSAIKASRTPLNVVVRGISGFIYAYVKGTDASNGLLKIFVQDAVAANPLAEMANALAIPAGASGDTITFEAEWLGME